MKILFITTKSPLPTNDGHSLRTFNLLKAVSQHHDVTLLSFVKFPLEYEFKSELKKYCSSVQQFSVPDNCSRTSTVISACLNILDKEPYVARKYNQSPMREEIRRLLNNNDFDLVHLDMLPLGVFLDEVHIPVILNEHNVESALLKRRCESVSNPVAKWYFTEQQRRLEVFETQAVKNVTHAIACSEEDKVILKAMVPTQQISVVPNGVDTDFYQSGNVHAEVPYQLAFVGGMNWFPNRDAVNWFDQSVMKELIQKNQKIHLNVVGKSVEGMKNIHDQHITMLGFVEDTRPYIESASVIIVPIRVGGGTRLKVLEAMSMGKAMVSTSVGVEGIRVSHRKHVLIADTPEEFASSISELLHNADLRKKLGNAARELVCQMYQWDKIGLSLLDVYRDATECIA
jgi:glycosyltransferase involved in cell wall biosynthesis